MSREWPRLEARYEGSIDPGTRLWVVREHQGTEQPTLSLVEAIVGEYDAENGIYRVTAVGINHAWMLCEDGVRSRFGATRQEAVEHYVAYMRKRCADAYSHWLRITTLITSANELGRQLEPPA